MILMLLMQVATVPEGAELKQAAFSADGKRVIFSIRKDGKECVVLDGKVGEPFDEVENVFLDSDGADFAKVRRGKKWTHLVRGKASGWYDDATYLSGQGGRTGFFAQDGGRHYAVVDGTPGEAFDGMEPLLTFSSDGKRFAYVGHRGKQMVAVVDGKAGEAYDYVQWPDFSPDGRTVAYEAKRGKQYFVVVEGKTHGPFEDVSSVEFSPNGPLIYFVRDAGKCWLVVDGVRCAIPPCRTAGYVVAEKGTDRILYQRSDDTFVDTVVLARIVRDGANVTLQTEREVVAGDLQGFPAFVPGGGFAFSAVDDEGAYFEKDGKRVRLPDAEFIADLELSADGKRVAVIQNIGDKYAVWHDGVSHRSWEYVDRIEFGEGGRLAYGVIVGEKQYVVIDGRKVEEEFEYLYQVKFSRDGKHTLALGSRGHRGIGLLDGAPLQEYDSVWHAEWSEDGTKLVLGVSVGRELRWVVRAP